MTDSYSGARTARPIAPATPASTPTTTPPATAPARAADSDAMPCDRCGTPMFRMHAVWRCPACGYKTDCCGW